MLEFWTRTLNLYRKMSLLLRNESKVFKVWNYNAHKWPSHWAWWHMSIILVLRKEAKAGGSLQL